MNTEKTTNEPIEAQAITEHILWTREISGSAGGVGYEGTLQLVYNAKSKTFSMRANVRKPASLTTTRPINSRTEERFWVSVVLCWHKVTDWRLSGRSISFTYDMQAFHFGWNRIFHGRVSGTIPETEGARVIYDEMLKSHDPWQEPLVPTPAEAVVTTG